MWDFLIDILSLPIIDYVSRIVIVLVIYLLMKDFVVDTWTSWRSGGFKMLSTNLLKLVLTLVVVGSILGLGFPKMLKLGVFLWNLVVDKLITPVWDRITR